MTTVATSLAEVDLEGLFQIDVTFGKLKHILHLVLTKLQQQEADLEVVKQQSGNPTQNGVPDLGEIEKKVEQLTDKLNGLPERVAALEARPSDFDDSILDDFMANHERRLQHLEQDLLNGGHASDHPERQGSGKIASPETEAAGTQPKPEATRGQRFQIKKGLPMGGAKAPKEPGRAGSQTPPSPSSPQTKPPTPPPGEPDTMRPAPTTQSVYEKIGSPPVSARGLIRSGLSSRMRSLVDDHEARLKQLEHQLRNPTKPQPSAGDGDALKELAAKVEQLNTGLNGLGARVDSLPKVSFEGSGTSMKPDEELARLVSDLSRRLGNVEKQLRDLDGVTSEQVRGLAAGLQDANQHCDKLRGDLDRLREQYREDNAAEAVRRSVNDLKLLAIRVGVLEDISNRVMAQPYVEEDEEGEAQQAPQQAPTIDEHVFNVRLKALQDGLELATNATHEANNLIRGLQQRVDDVGGLANRNSNRLDDAEKELRKQGAAKDALEGLTKAHNDLKEVVAGIDGRLKREGQNVALLNSKIAGLSKPVEHKEPPKAVAKGAREDAGPRLDSGDLRQLKESLAGLLEVVGEHAQQLSQLDLNKVDRHDLNGLMDRLDTLAERQKQLGDKAEATSRALATRTVPTIAATPTGQTPPPGAHGIDVAAELGNLKVLLGTHGSMIDNLFADKANRDTVVRQGQEIQDLKKMLETRAKLSGRGSTFNLKDAGRGGGGAGGGGKAVDADMYAELADMLAQHDSKLASLKDTKADAAALEQKLRPVLDLLETLQLNKADAGVVAGKAERDYVETALEKLRREVEQVMNSTNSGLIDTLDKSLNILRDMIDGKANTGDLLKLQEMLMSTTGKDDTPEGLAGYKHYRCLSCNRKMDGMRPRPMGMNFMNFMTHLPNPRNKQYNSAATKRIGAPPANLLPGPPVRALPGTAPTHGDFLPPLEQGPHVTKGYDYSAESAEASGIAAPAE